MATQAVKFYSVASLPSQPNNAALYFVNGGELYKGAQRFGANKVYTANANAADLSAATEGLTDIIAGDILLGFQGAKVWDGAAWQDLSADIESIIESVASTFTTGESDGQLKLGSVNATVSGWDYVDFLKGVVTSTTTTVDEEEITTTTVTASVGTFGNLTVGGKTVPEIAAEVIASISASTEDATDTDAGITVSVTTSGGSVTEVQVAGPSIATVIRADGVAEDTRVASEKAVRDAISSFDNAVHFAGVGAALPSVAAENKAGDIFVVGANPTGYITPTGQYASEAGEGDVNTALVEGQEYIWDGTKWEKIGDQNAVTGGTSTSTVNGVTVEVITAAATAFPSVTLSGIGTAASVDFATSVTESADTLPTGGAVYTFVNGLVSNLDATPTDAGTDGVSVAVVEEDGIITGVTTTVTKATLNTTLGTTEVADKGVATSIGPTTSTPASGTEGQEGYVPAVDAASNDNLATEKAVRDAITDAVNTAELVWLDEDGDPIDDSPAPEPEPEEP